MLEWNFLNTVTRLYRRLFFCRSSVHVIPYCFRFCFIYAVSGNLSSGLNLGIGWPRGVRGGLPWLAMIGASRIPQRTETLFGWSRSFSAHASVDFFYALELVDQCR